MDSRTRRVAVMWVCALAASAAWAQPTAEWPRKPARMMVPSAAGTAPDVMARLIGERLAKLWGMPWWWRTSRVPAT